MGNVFGYVWGIWWWRITANTTVDGLRTDDTSLPTARGIQEIQERGALQAWQWGTTRKIPTHVAVDVALGGKVPHTHNDTITLHQWRGLVLLGSLCRISNTSLVCSPEFCYLQVAGVIKSVISEPLENWQYLIVLIELGCELCGTYAKQNNARGYKLRKKSLVTTSRIWAFLMRMGHEYGASVLRRAMAWVLDGLRSPMETCLYMLLCLPPYLGGLGLPAPVSNCLIAVPSGLWGTTKLRHICPDLLWPEFMLIVEYDSDEIHEDQAAEDQARRELAQEMGYAVITVRLQDLEDITKLRAKAELIAKRLGRTLPAQSERFCALHRMLRDMLVFHDRWI